MAAQKQERLKVFFYMVHYLHYVHYIQPLYQKMDVTLGAAGQLPQDLSDRALSRPKQRVSNKIG